MFVPATSFLSAIYKYLHKYFIFYRSKWENYMLTDSECKFAFY